MRVPIRFGAAMAVALAIGAIGLPARAAFPGDNGRIVFSSNQTGFFELYSMNPDGSGVTQLTNLHQCARGPWVSPDGTKIVFHSTPAGVTPCSNGFQIYSMNADGTGVTQLTNNYPAVNMTPAWSADGTHIAFVSNRTGACQIYTMNADGSGVTQITYSGPRGLGGVSWSPDGTRLTYGTAVTGTFCPSPLGAGLGNLEIHVINADGSGDQTLESEAFNSSLGFNTSRHPDWSPDGSQITYASSRSGELQIWTMNDDGTGQTQVTHDPNTPENFSRFSPEGLQLVFQAASTQGVEIRVVNVNGTHEQKVISDKFRNVQPSWGPSTD